VDPSFLWPCVCRSATFVYCVSGGLRRWDGLRAVRGRYGLLAAKCHEQGQ
jgi:hypothetical protein